MTRFESGSIIVYYTLTLKKGAVDSDKDLQDELNAAFLLNNNDSDVVVREDSLIVTEYRIPVPGLLRMVIFSYVGCTFALLGALVVGVYMSSRCAVQFMFNSIFFF